MKEIITDSAQQTEKLGKRLGETLSKGDIVCLSGDLGVGKTAFTKGIATGLDIQEHITSPTFTIVNEYMGEPPLYHFDVYRISDPEEMFEIGFEEYLYGNGVVVIEWADLIKELVPGEHIWVEIRKNPDGDVDERIIRISFIGSRYKGREEAGI